MGYYTTIEISLSVKAEKLEEFRQRLAELRAQSQANPEHCWFWNFEDLELSENGWLRFSEDCRKWYEPERFYQFIAPYVNEGYIEGHCEDMDDIWRICFDGKGGFKGQVAVFVDEDSDTMPKAGGVAAPDKATAESRLSCPSCGSVRFVRHADEEVEMVDNGEYVTDELCGGWTEYTYRCTECGKEVTESELVPRCGSPILSEKQMT
jgi:DNA-directed RNA polymerase subunit RPC12/RpoP